VALDDVSFDASPGQIYGLLGPNGAGKTTLIRMMLDIIRPDSGTIEVLGHKLTDRDKDRIAYLPEERGLYLRQKVISVLIYLGRLKGLDRGSANRAALSWLERLGMSHVKDKKVRDLSKGNQQKIQLIATLVADPEIIILDEPFSGLDPINTRDVSILIKELAAAGKTVLLSTHQMGLVETLCNRVLMIHHGRRVFYGNLDSIKQQYSDNAVLIKSNADYSRCGFIDHYSQKNGAVKVYLRDGNTSGQFLNWLVDEGVEVDQFQRASSPLEDIYIKVVEQRATHEVESVRAHV
jgi:ABC-2 type transport system ATP-binding protein